jgi:flagellar hook-associated protein 2
MVPVYNYLIESNPYRQETKYHASKRSELQKVYNRIVNLSSRSPFFKINLSQENQEYTIGIKETALALKAKLNDIEIPEISGFHSKTITVSNENILSAKLVNGNVDALPENITFAVQALASAQKNVGKELFHPSHGLKQGDYEFYVKVPDQTYSLTFSQKGSLENIVSMKNLADFLNKNVPELKATVEEGSVIEYSRIVITSVKTGMYDNRTFYFEDEDSNRIGISDFFGLNRMEIPPDNAHFELNGIQKQTSTNTFTLENALQVSLLQTTDQPVNIRIVPDSKQIITSVASVLDTFNGFIQLAKNRTQGNTEHIGATKLISELMNLEVNFQSELEAGGIKINEDGSLSINVETAVKAAEDGSMESLFTGENGFIARLKDKTEAIAINPMDYLDKIIVTYPNNQKVISHNPYITSMYSGLLFNSYC